MHDLPPYNSLENSLLLAGLHKVATMRPSEAGNLVCAWTVLAVFPKNLILIVIDVTNQEIGQDVQKVIYDGSCSYDRPLDIGIHLIINALSTLYLVRVIPACNA